LSSLDFAAGAEALELEGAGEGVEHGEAEIVEACPDPEAGGFQLFVVVRAHADEDVGLAGDGEIGGGSESAVTISTCSPARAASIWSRETGAPSSTASEMP